MIPRIMSTNEGGNIQNRENSKSNFPLPMNDDSLFHYYDANIYSTSAKGTLKITTLLRAIQQPKPLILNKIMQIRETHEKEERDRLKKELFFFVPCCLTDKNNRGYNNIISFTGWMLLDFDGIENESIATKFKEYIFKKYDFIMSAWLSSSGLGVRAFVKIPIVQNVDEFKRLYWGLVTKEMGQYGSLQKTWCDDSMQKPTQPLFYSYDKNILFRPDYTIWDTGSENPSRAKAPTTARTTRQRYLITETQITANIRKAMNKIIDNGHPQVLKAAFALGGYVCQNKINFDDAEYLLHTLIENNQYLGKGIAGYKKTASQALIAGQNYVYEE